MSDDEIDEIDDSSAADGADRADGADGAETVATGERAETADEAKAEKAATERGAARPASASGPPVTRSVIGSLVAVACVYELVAEGVNTVMQEPILPSVTTAITRFRARAVASRLAPRSARTGAMLGAGYLIGAITTRSAKSSS